MPCFKSKRKPNKKVVKMGKKYNLVKKVKKGR